MAAGMAAPGGSRGTTSGHRGRGGRGTVPAGLSELWGDAPRPPRRSSREGGSGVSLSSTNVSASVRE